MHISNFYSLIQRLRIFLFRVRYCQVILHSSVLEIALLACMGLVASYLVYNGSISVVDMIISDLLGVEYQSLPEEVKVDTTDSNDSPEEAKKKAFRKKLYDTGLTCFCALLIIGALALSVDSF